MNRTQFRVLLALIVVSVMVIVASFVWSTMSSSPSAESTTDAPSDTTQTPESLTEVSPQEIKVVDASAIDAAGAPADDATQQESGSANGPSNGATSSVRASEKSQLTIGIARDLAPFSFTSSDGTATGFEIALAQELAGRWLNGSAPVELLILAPGEAANHLANDDADLVIASLARTRNNDGALDFSQTYFFSEQMLLVGAGSPYNALEDLNGETVAVIDGSTQVAELINKASDRGITFELLYVADSDSALDAVQGSDAAALAGDRFVLERIAAANGNLRLLEPAYGEAHFAVALKPGNQHLREMVNYTLQDMKADGSFDALYRRWFPDLEPYAIHISGGFWPYSFSTLPTAESEVASTFQSISERGKILAGIDAEQAPFGLLDSEGQISGFDPAIVRALAKEWLGDEDAVEFVAGTRAEQIDRLAAGDIDMVAAAIDNARDWADLVDFSQPYVGPPATEQALRLALPQGDQPFRELTDYTLQKLQRDGTYAEISNYWLGAGTPLFALETIPTAAGFVPRAYSPVTASSSSSSSSAGSTTSSSTTPASTPVSTNVISPSDSTVTRIRALDNVLRAGVKADFSPFGFLDDGGGFVGFDVDLVQALANSWGVDVEFVPVTSANRIQTLIDGKVDLVAASMTHTQGRDADIDFSQTYFADGQSLLVRRDTGINSIGDMDGRPVAAIEGSTSIIQINDHAAANGVSVEIVPFQAYPSAVEQLVAGTVDAVTTDSVALQQFANENPSLAVVGELFTNEPYGMGVRAGDSTFAGLVNSSLQSLKQSGVYDQLYAKWFGENATPYPVEVLPGQHSYTFANAPTAWDAPDASRFERILRTGVLAAGLNQDRLAGDGTEGGQPAGFEIDIVREFAKRWLGDAEAVTFTSVAEDTAVGLMRDDAIDLVLPMLNAHDNSEQVNFSQTYARSQAGDNEPLAVALPLFDHALRDLVNFTLQEMKTDGSYDRLVRKWFGNTQPFAVEVWPGESYLPVNLTPMVSVPAGAFVRGDAKGLSDEQPERTIYVDNFYVDQYEVSNRLYDLCVRAASCKLPQRSFSLASGLYYADPTFHNFPAIWVTGEDAADYCAFVNKRLPTEAEWEKAARGESGASYPWGDEEPSDQANFDYARGDLAEVGVYLADESPYGVNDMAGNAREWTADWYIWDYYGIAPERNPTGPETGTTIVVRGGAWDDQASALRSTARRNLLPISADANLGFRCVSSTPPSR